MNPSVPGVPCPDCGRAIIATLDQLVSGRSIDCSCGLKMRVDEERSREVIAGLRKLKSQLGETPR
jgi:hypothetical protein